MHRARVPAVDVSLIGTKRGDFKLETVFEYNDHAKMRADRVCPGEKRLHIFRAGVCCDVIIFWCQSAHQVAYAATCEVRNMPLLTQPRCDFARGRFHWRRVHSLTVAASPGAAQFRQPAGLYSALLSPKRMNNKQH